MVKVIGVRFRTAGKIYFFAPGKFEIKQGSHVIVETARGMRSAGRMKMEQYMKIPCRTAESDLLNPRRLAAE